ncbi:hypothetical protein COCON_G00015020 [Conger conger]|uniref:Ergosterol biosynthetic protein 28 n=2 Tax=Conger conger TaxID=82655 RepID=A0A9Q1E398_CONCO|nr:hypothetical protein COCON_G00015020 [Conger conger]
MSDVLDLIFCSYPINLQDWPFQSVLYLWSAVKANRFPKRTKMSRFLNVLRSWLVMVAVIAMGNTVQSFRDHSFLSEKLYTGTPEFVNGLQARTFGIWTLLSSIIRCACAIDIQNKTLYHITLWTFILALGHFLSEAFIYKTAPLTIGVMAPLIVASVSILGMLIGFQCVGEPQEVVGARQKKRN